MRNEIAEGTRLTITATAAIKGGDLVIQGAVFGIASSDAAIGDQCELQLGKVYTQPKLSTDVVTVGQKLYWDTTNKRLTTTVGSNVYIGVAYDAAANGDLTGNVRLNFSF